MGKLHFDYWMEILYTEPVTECHYTVKCLPQNTDMQKISELNIEIMPRHDYQENEDSFGNLMIYNNLYCEHNRFSFRVSGIAVTGLAEGDREKEGKFSGIYCCPHGLNKAGDEIKAYFHEQMKNIGFDDSVYQIAIYLMKCLHRDFIYEKGITNVNTTAEEAWKYRHGVCQDYAHIFIALCHLAKIPARYVTGMMIGEGYSHAWVEVLADKVWYGLDPTNGCIVADNYIKIGIGRDANDCVINKGIITGGGLQNLAVSVRVGKIS